MIRVCDAIMGTGKTSATITYLNEHKDQKFIYITPYLAEAARIKDGCPDLQFVEPSGKLKKYGFSKSAHTEALVAEGRNITTTHQAFKGYTMKILDNIREQGYVLIIDENVDVLEQFDVHPGDLEMAIDGGYIVDKGEELVPTGKEYSGFLQRDMFRMFKSRKLIKIRDDKNTDFFYWALPPELITSFKDVFILTYLFKGQSLHNLLSIYGLEFEYIGVERTEDGGYRFGKCPGYVPEYVSHLKDMIHILDERFINSIGNNRYALSVNWFSRNTDGIEQVKKNVSNFFNTKFRGVPPEKRLWGTFDCAREKTKGKGYTKSYLAFNRKATNDYRECTHLAYTVNIFMNVSEKTFYKLHGIDVDEDAYALSIMVQWIWRSAIRDGKEIYLYIPSKRMRNILLRWIETTSSGGDVS